MTKILFMDDIAIEEKFDLDKLLYMLSKAPKRKFNESMLILHTEYSLDELKKDRTENDNIAWV